MGSEPAVDGVDLDSRYDDHAVHEARRLFRREHRDQSIPPFDPAAHGLPEPGATRRGVESRRAGVGELLEYLDDSPYQTGVRSVRPVDGEGVYQLHEIRPN